MTKRMDHLLAVVGETRRLVLQDRKTVTAARIEATRIRARERDLEEGTGTVHDSYAPRRNAGRGPADLDQAIEEWMHGDEKAIRGFLLSGDDADEQSVDLFLASFSDTESGLRETARAMTSCQGIITDANTRKAVEDRAMSLAEAHYRELFDVVENTAATKPFDFRCTKGNQEVRVEVKGSTGEARQIFVTAGEVKNAQGTGWRTDLYIVSGIILRPTKKGPAAEGGIGRVIPSWRPKDEDLEATIYRYLVPDESGA
jgi:hypothetical protein